MKAWFTTSLILMVICAQRAVAGAQVTHEKVNRTQGVDGRDGAIFIAICKSEAVSRFSSDKPWNAAATDALDCAKQHALARCREQTKGDCEIGVTTSESERGLINRYKYGQAWALPVQISSEPSAPGKNSIESERSDADSQR